MGVDARNYLPPAVRRKDIEEFLLLLGYEKTPRDDIDKKIKATTFFYFNEKDYKHVTGVYASVLPNEEGGLQVQTHTTIWRSKFDSDFHNFTIKQIWKRFGGTFDSDNGKRRYLTYNKPTREKAEGGCYLAFFRFQNNLTKAKILIEFRDFSNYQIIKPGIMPWFDDSNPMIISNNMIVPYLVSVMEDYFKWTFIALLKYSDKKTSILKNARFSDDDLTLVSDRLLNIEEAATRWMSFQDIKKICDHFHQLDKKIDISGVLRKPYRRRKESLYSGIERIVEHRHLLIHNSLISPIYTDDKVKKDIDIVEVAIKRVYDMLIANYKWNARYP